MVFIDSRFKSDGKWQPWRFFFAFFIVCGNFRMHYWKSRVLFLYMSRYMIFEQGGAYIIVCITTSSQRPTLNRCSSLYFTIYTFCYCSAPYYFKLLSLNSILNHIKFITIIKIITTVLYFLLNMRLFN